MTRTRGVRLNGFEEVLQRGVGDPCLWRETGLSEAG